MISYLLYQRARRQARTVFDVYLVQSRDRGVWRGIVAGTFDIPRWLRPTHGPLAQNNVRILFGRPAETLLLLDQVEAETDRPIRNVWPALRGFIHEGPDFSPYAQTFQRRLGAGVAFVAGIPDEPAFLNAFGESLAEEEIDAALAAAQRGCGGEVTAHRIAPEFPTAKESRGRHVIEIVCTTPPPDLGAFARAFDEALPHRARPLLRAPIVRLVRAL